MGQFIPLIKQISTHQLEQLEKGGSVTLAEECFTKQDFLILREARANTNTLSNRHISIVLDCTLTDELLEEGLAREVVNRIQKTRKELGFNVNDRIQIVFSADTPLTKAINNHSQHICKETLTTSLKAGKAGQNSFQIEKHNLTMDISRV